MIQHRFRPTKSTPAAVALLAVLGASTSWAQDDDVRIIQPGAPGEPSKVISADDAANLAGILYTQADVEFMQGMIGHHAQALEMTELLETRSRSSEMRDLAKRIELSQDDEIEMMQEWLRSRGEDVPEIRPTLGGGMDHGDGGHGDGGHGDGDHAGHDMAEHGGGHHMMPGMLTADEMQALKDAEGPEFDRLFLEKMIEHHRGALVMVDDLLAQRGAAQESTIFAFTNDVVADQTAEMDRMGGMLANMSPDPRVGLKPGFRDAGMSLANLELVAAIPKATGFFNPDAPEGVPIPTDRDRDEDAEDEAKEEEEEASDEETEEAQGDGEAEDAEEAEEAAEEDDKAAEAARRAAMGSILNFAQSDLAFTGTTLFNGNFHGFNTYNVEDPANPRLLASVVCPGGQGDVSVVGDLLIMSVEQTRGRLDCGLQGVADPVSKERFRGVRIFDISDLRMPQQVAAVQTCRGSHTHTVVDIGSDEIVIYGSGTSSVRPGDELEGCSDLPPGEDENTALFSIDVITIPVADPSQARIVNRPRIFADEETGRIAGLWRGGRHGTGTQRTSVTNQCHDITVFPDRNLAAGACSGNGILLDITDPVNPKRLDAVIDPGFAYWHSATFNNDGSKVIFTDEWGGGMRPRCRASDPREWGANAVFDVTDDKKLEFKSYYKLPAPQSETENCVAHNGSLVPVPGRDIMVQAWYQGGISVFDFTDSNNPVEIAHFDRGPINGDNLMMGGHWSAYWYDGHIYATEIARGLDVLALEPSEFLTQNEIDAANAVGEAEFNPQQQFMIEWPAEPVVVRALLDQLERAGALAPALRRPADAALDQAQRAIDRGTSDAGAARALTSAIDRIAEETEGTANERVELLQATTEAIRTRID